jgi:hypothetical protein
MRWKSQPPPQIPQIAGENAQPQPNLVTPEPVATRPRHLCSLLAFIDPLLGLPAMVVEVNDLPVRELCVGHDEAHPREQLPGMELYLGNQAPRRRPTGCPIKKPLYHATSLCPGRPTGRMSNPAIFRNRQSWAGIRIEYFAPRFSNASWISALANAASTRNQAFLPSFSWRSISGRSCSQPASL